MTVTASFPYADVLHALTQPGAPEAWPSLAHLLSGPDGARKAETLATLLKARKAVFDAAAATTLAVDELRRYQKFAKPGQPSAHIVQLRQKQAAARQATSVARQSLIKAAAVFVREAGIEVPARTPLDDFIVGWIDANVPRDRP